MGKKHEGNRADKKGKRMALHFFALKADLFSLSTLSAEFV